MIHRDKDFLNPPAGLIDSKYDTVKQKLLTEKNDHAVKSSIYRDTTIDALVKLYEDKCAICERKRGDELEVDHYRPKKERNFSTKPKYNHTGYYWLAYEWSNLIPLCSKCNNKKSNKFPLNTNIESHRATDEKEEGKILSALYDPIFLQEKEKPLLINPEIDIQPEVHVKYLPSGAIVGRTANGKETIHVLKLNRKTLLRERKEVIQKYLRDILDACNDYKNHQNNDELRGELKAIFKRIKRNQSSEEAYSLLHKYIHHFFKDFIVDQLPKSIQNTILNSFESFKKGMRSNEN